MTDRGTALAILFILVLFGAGLFFVFPGAMPVRWHLGDRVGMLPVEGTIGTAQTELRRLERLLDRDDVRGLVVEIRSPGGAVGGSQALYRALRDLRDEREEFPVVAWIGGIGASGGYYAALGADSILALPGAITGSIGVIMQFPDAQELLRKVGLRMEIVQSGPFKDAGSPFRSLSEEDRRVLGQLVDDVYEQFVGAVAAERGLGADSVRVLADGRVYSGERAARIGLVDRTATLDEAISAAGLMAGVGADPDTVYPPTQGRGLLDLLLEAGSTGLRDWLGWSPGSGSASPRLLYQWK